MDFQQHNRRAHLRKDFFLRKKILVNERREARLKNISLGGACFHSDEAHDVGKEIIVGNRLMSIFAEVVGCRPDTVQNGHAAIHGHEVRCKYAPTKELLQEELLMEQLEGEENTITV